MKVVTVCTLLTALPAAHCLLGLHIFRPDHDLQKIFTPSAMDPVGPVVPPAHGDKPSDPRPPPAQGTVILSDVMGRDKSINIFASFTRQVETVQRRLDDGAQNTTVLAPLNSAVEALPRKPWEDPRDYGTLGEEAYGGEEGYERAQRNLRRFVEAHIIPMSPWSEGEKCKPLGDDRDVWWEEKNGKRMIHPGEIEVVSVSSSVSNGEVWIIKNVRNYA